MPENCQFCTLQKGDSLRIATMSDSACNICGNTFRVYGLMIFKETINLKGQFIHRFLVLDSMTCSECKGELHIFHTPCGGQYKLDITFEKVRHYA